VIISLSALALAGMACIAGVLLGRRSALIRFQRSAVRLEPSREQLLSWLEQAPAGWIVLDGKNRVRFINGRAERLLALSPSERTALHLGELGTFQSLLDLIGDVRDHQQPQRLEWDVANQELEIFALSGQQRSVALMLQSRRSLEAQLKQQERWVSDVAHELKTPLTALLLVGDSLAATVNDQNEVLVQRLLKELKRMQDLVGDLLELSRLENVLPGQGIKLERIHLASLIQEAWQGIKPMADQKAVRVEMERDDPDSPPHSPPLFINADRTRMHRALLNLFDNALRHSPVGGLITVDLRCSNDWIRIGIRDQGPGLSEQDLEHMFERFYRGDASRFRQQRGGSGLGLAIVQQIILAHGGWVSGENDNAGGAYFELRLPLTKTASS
jgi:two-component system phosphate regulon sensor histidine kinase PhoR